jgi:hypothetical protein
MPGALRRRGPWQRQPSGIQPSSREGRGPSRRESCRTNRPRAGPVAATRAATQRPKWTGAALLVSRASRSPEAAPAPWPDRSAAEAPCREGGGAGGPSSPWPSPPSPCWPSTGRATRRSSSGGPGGRAYGRGRRSGSCPWSGSGRSRGRGGGAGPARVVGFWELMAQRCGPGSRASRSATYCGRRGERPPPVAPVGPAVRAAPVAPVGPAVRAAGRDRWSGGADGPAQRALHRAERALLRPKPPAKAGGPGGGKSLTRRPGRGTR